MNNSYLMELIKCLPHSDLIEIEESINIKYFYNETKRKEILHLFDICKNLILDKKNKLNDKINISNKIFKDQKYIPGKIEKLMVELVKNIKEYLLKKKHFDNNNSILNDIEWLEILILNKMYNRFLIYSKKVNTQIERLPESLEKKFLKYKLDSTILNFNSIHNKQIDDINLFNTLESLDKFYLISRLDLEITLLLQNYIIKLPKDTESKINKWDSFDFNYNDNHITILRKIIDLLQSPNIELERLYELDELIEINKNNLSCNELTKIYSYQRNISTLYHNRGIPGMLALQLKYQKKHLLEGYLFDNGQLLVSTYTSIAISALRLNEIDWAYEFIEKYKDKVRGETSNNGYYKINLSRYHFAVNQFEKALELIPFDLVEPVYNHIAKRLEIKCCYELQSELLEYKMDAFKMYVSRTSSKILPENLRPFQINFINILFQLTNATPGDKKRAITIIRRIIEKKTVAEKEWLLEKARELGRLNDEEYEAALKGG